MKKVLVLIVLVVLALAVLPMWVLAAPLGQTPTPPPDVINLIIGAIGLPAFAAAILWLAAKLGVPVTYYQIIALIVSAVFAVLVLVLKFYPQYDQVIVGVVSFLYTLIMTMEQFFPNAAIALFGSPEQKAKLAAKFVT